MTKPLDKWTNFFWPADETWLPVSEFPGYEVSDLGRVRSLRHKHKRLIQPFLDGDGYQRVSMLCSGRRVNGRVSRMVALAFIGLAPVGKNYCCHLDGTKTNNRPANLRWDSQVGNMADRHLHGTELRGSRAHNASTTESVIAEVKRRLAVDPEHPRKMKDIALQCGLTYNTVYRVARKGAWSHVSTPRTEEVAA